MIPAVFFSPEMFSDNTRLMQTILQNTDTFLFFFLMEADVRLYCTNKPIIIFIRAIHRTDIYMHVDINIRFRSNFMRTLIVVAT